MKNCWVLPRSTDDGVGVRDPKTSVSGDSYLLKIEVRESDNYVMVECKLSKCMAVKACPVKGNEMKDILGKVRAHLCSKTHVTALYVGTHNACSLWHLVDTC